MATDQKRSVGNEIIGALFLFAGAVATVVGFVNTLLSGGDGPFSILPTLILSLVVTGGLFYMAARFLSTPLPNAIFESFLLVVFSYNIISSEKVFSIFVHPVMAALSFVAYCLILMQTTWSGLKKTIWCLVAFGVWSVVVSSLHI